MVIGCEDEFLRITATSTEAETPNRMVAFVLIHPAVSRIGIHRSVGRHADRSRYVGFIGNRPSIEEPERANAVAECCRRVVFGFFGEKGNVLLFPNFI